jgi:hypothetical protein
MVFLNRPKDHLNDNIGEKKIKVNNNYIRFDGFCEDTKIIIRFNKSIIK